jgi:hypothetical protein
MLLRRNCHDGGVGTEILVSKVFRPSDGANAARTAVAAAAIV